jgi:hypothetical protein
MNTTIFGNGGEVVINDDGYPLEQRPSDMVPDEHDGYADIIRFDVDEFRKHYGLAELPGSIDILAIGYWHPAGYEPAEQELRRHEHMHNLMNAAADYVIEEQIKASHSFKKEE